MAKDELREQVLEMLASLDPSQVKDLERDFQLALMKADRDSVPERDLGTPKDPAVRLAAAWAFKFWRDPAFRRHAMRSLADKPLSYDDIGERLVKASRERVRQLYADLCPLDYESEKKMRGANMVGTGT
jgi:hypothetical protein